MKQTKLIILTILGGFVCYALKIIAIHGIPKVKDIDPDWINNPTELRQDDDALLDVVRRNFLKPPLEESVPYNFSHYNRTVPMCNTSYSQESLSSPDFNPSCGQVQRLEDILRQLSPGFFLDCGAHDGIFVSNTIWLERKLGWSGLLVEADPNAYNLLESINRKAWLSNTCFSIAPYPKKMEFFINPKYAEASGLIRSDYYGATQSITVQCLPLYTTLLALGRTVIDFFTLDVEGNEMEILGTIPFDKIVFKVLTIEHLFIPGGKKAVKNFMKSKGYIFYQTVVNEGSADSIFLHSSIKLNEEQIKQVGHEDKKKKGAIRQWR